VEEYKHKQKEEEAKFKEAQKRREERSQALARYHANKAEVFRKLSMKTKKGQPVMNGCLPPLRTPPPPPPQDVQDAPPKTLVAAYLNAVCTNEQY
jgi:hypothetical protein